ncbi:hypothetical protein [Mammaliicoccus sciuri]|uniref:hypothetical protein n=1 Tax=Mammaliicoccus sciuri TaxID=1296 RepID=UPI0021CFBAF3|nr:hypothetical protein [Mammaliicoccus sciuri]UXU70209.1 hypothetical protein MUA36_05870 [Mammaliicoccus sciuri]
MINTEMFKKSYNGEFKNGGASGVDIKTVAQQIANELEYINNKKEEEITDLELENLTEKILTMDKMMIAVKEDVHMLLQEKLW